MLISESKCDYICINMSDDCGARETQRSPLLNWVTNRVKMQVHSRCESFVKYSTFECSPAAESIFAFCLSLFLANTTGEINP